MASVARPGADRQRPWRRGGGGLRHLEDTGGFELGTGPSIVVIDTGAAKALTTTTLQKDIYAMVFGQQGLMAGGAYVLEEGRIVSAGTPTELLAQPHIRSAYLGYGESA